MEKITLESQNNGISFSAAEFKPKFNNNSSFWRMFVDNDVFKEDGIYSSDQTPVSITVSDNITQFLYTELVTRSGAKYKIELNVFIKEQEDGSLEFSADLTNNDDIRINEMQLPYLDYISLGSSTEDETLYLPLGLGMRFKNPREYISEVYHTEYMSADYEDIQMNTTYPHCLDNNTALSMPWSGVQSGNYFVYLARHDDFFRISGISYATSPRNTDSRLMAYCSTYPALLKNENIQIKKSVLAIFKGDWRCGSAYYRKWSETSWYKKDKNIPDWVRNMTGWQRIILKHQYGEIFFKYKDLPKIYENGRKYGINTLLVFGWWKGRFDNNYPEYEVDPELGGERELKKAIAKVQSLGGRVILYSNGNLIDVKTDYYKNTGFKICHKDIDENEYREHYRFSGSGTILRNFGYKSFVTACHSTPEWQENLVRVGKLKLSFGCDSIFYDQLCCCNKLCFDKSHPHENRIDEEPSFRHSNVAAINSNLSAGQALGTEWVADRMANAVDYIHGCGPASYYETYSYPDLYMHTFPGLVVTNRFIHDDRSDFKEQLNYAFVSGLIFDVSIYRGRKIDMSGITAYSEHIKYLLSLKEKYSEFFYGGKFESACDLNLPEKLHASRFVKGSRSIIALWNNTGVLQTVKIGKNRIELESNQVGVLEER